MIPVDHPEVGRVRAGALLTVMKRQRSWGDRELLGGNTDDNTDYSEQDESLSLRSSWSLVVSQLTAGHLVGYSFGVMPQGLLIRYSFCIVWFGRLSGVIGLLL